MCSKLAHCRLCPVFSSWIFSLQCVQVGGWDSLFRSPSHSRPGRWLHGPACSQPFTPRPRGCCSASYHFLLHSGTRRPPSPVTFSREFPIPFLSCLLSFRAYEALLRLVWAPASLTFCSRPVFKAPRVPWSGRSDAPSHSLQGRTPPRPCLPLLLRAHLPGPDALSVKQGPSVLAPLLQQSNILNCNYLYVRLPHSTGYLSKAMTGYCLAPNR